MRVWERGAGITLACGSGACATAVAAHLRGLTGKRVTLDLDGGVLEIDWREDGVWMAGPVARVFDGILPPALIAKHSERREDADDDNDNEQLNYSKSTVHDFSIP